MHKYKYRHILLFLFTLALGSCVTVPSQPPEPLPAGYLYADDYLNVRVPNSNGWHLVDSSSTSMQFGRKGTETGETFGAQVIMFPLPQTQSDDEFVTLIKNSWEADTNTVRYSVIKSDFQSSKQRSYPCVSVASIVQDNQAQISSTRTAKLILQTEAIYCRHPVQQDTGFSIIYSHRGTTIYSDLSAEAKDFIAGVQVPDHL